MFWFLQSLNTCTTLTWWRTQQSGIFICSVVFGSLDFRQVSLFNLEISVVVSVVFIIDTFVISVVVYVLFSWPLDMRPPISCPMGSSTHPLGILTPSPLGYPPPPDTPIQSSQTYPPPDSDTRRLLLETIPPTPQPPAPEQNDQIRCQRQRYIFQIFWTWSTTTQIDSVRFYLIIYNHFRVETTFKVKWVHVHRTHF